MTSHDPSCASVTRLLLSDPPQKAPCDCGVGAAAPGNVVSFLRAVPVENAGGAPAAPAKKTSIADELRELARKLDAGEVGPLRHMICIPVDAIGTGSPDLMGGPMSIAEIIGRLEISKTAVLESLWVDVG